MAEVNVTTPHYGIAQYGPKGEGQAAALYTIYNVAMDTIDQILWQLKQLIDALEERVGDLENRMDAAEERITNLENRMEQAETNISNLQETVENLQQQIDVINENITNIENNVSDLTDSVWAAIEAIVNHTTGGGTVDQESGSISWGLSGQYAIGNMNIYNGSSNYIRTTANTLSSPGTNDVRVN